MLIIECSRSITIPFIGLAGADAYIEAEDVLVGGNYEIRRPAVRTGRDRDYFDDCFAGAVSHYTAKGTRLVAEHESADIITAFFPEFSAHANQ